MSRGTTIKAKSIPSKRTLNLVIKEKKEFRISRVLPWLVVILVAAAAFAKFAVIDRYAALNEAEAVLAGERAKLEALVNSYADYDEVQAEYNRYTYEDFDRTIPDRQDVLRLIERYVFPVSGMQQMAISGRFVSTTLTGMTLEGVSRLVAKLEADPLVDSVTVSTTGYFGRNYSRVITDEDEGSVPIASMVIALADATTLEGGEE